MSGMDACRCSATGSSNVFLLAKAACDDFGEIVAHQKLKWWMALQRGGQLRLEDVSLRRYFRQRSGIGSMKDVS
jgi:hypothetical protein